MPRFVTFTAILEDAYSVVRESHMTEEVEIISVGMFRKTR